MKTTDENWNYDEENGAILYTNKELFDMKRKLNTLEKMVQEQNAVIKEIFYFINNSKGQR